MSKLDDKKLSDVAGGGEFVEHAQNDDSGGQGGTEQKSGGGGGSIPIDSETPPADGGNMDPNPV